MKTRKDIDGNYHDDCDSDDWELHGCGPQHTPTPEKMLAELAKGYTVEDLVGFGISEGSAAFIVRAVNAHEALLVAAKIALDQLGKLPGSAQIGINPKACDLLQQAIAKAEGRI